MQPVKISQFTINDLIRQCTQAKTELSTLSQKISDLAGDMSVLKRSDASLMGQEIHGISSEQIEAMRKKYDCRTDSECLLAIQKQIEECSEHIKPLCDSVHAAKIVASKAIKETLSQTIPTKTKAARNTGKRTKIALLTTEIEEASSLGESLSKKVSEILSQKHKNPLPQDILTSEPPKKKPKTDLSSSQEHSSYEKITESFKRLHEAHSLLQQSKGGPKETASMSNYAAERRRFQQEIEVLRPSLNQPFVNKITQDAEELHMSAQRLHPQIPEPPRPVTEQPPPPSASSSNIGMP